MSENPHLSLPLRNMGLLLPEENSINMGILFASHSMLTKHQKTYTKKNINMTIENLSVTTQNVAKLLRIPKRK